MKDYHYVTRATMLLLMVVLLATVVSAIAVPMNVHEIRITVKNAPEFYFLSMLSPNSSVDTNEGPTQPVTDPGRILYYKAKQYIDENGFKLFAEYGAAPVIADYYGEALENGDRVHSFTCYRGHFLPEQFRIILIDQNKEVHLSNEIIQAHPLGTYLTYDVATGEVSNPFTEEQAPILLLCCLLTFLMDLLWYLKWNFPARKLWLMSLGVVMTVGLYLIRWTGAEFQTCAAFWIGCLCVEGGIFAVFLRPRKVRSVLAYVTVANSSSLILSWIMQGFGL